jgi:hypothetical protein
MLKIYRCEYATCDEKIESVHLPFGWSQYGLTRFHPRELANWCPRHSNDESTQRSDRLLQKAAERRISAEHAETPEGLEN